MGVRKSAHLTNARAKELTSDGITKAVSKVGKDKLAKAADVQIRTVEKWMGQASLPDLDHLLNMADECPLVIEAILSEKGWHLTPNQADPANDMQLAAGLGHSLAEFLDRIRDGRRCHVDTAVLAALFRQLVPQMQAIIDEDESLRRAA